MKADSISPQIIVIILLFIAFYCDAQKKSVPYSDKQICSNYETHRGKKLYGKKYCTGWMTVRYHADLRKPDTILYFMSTMSFIGDEYEHWKKLSPRNRIIYDSLQEDGHISMTSNYLQYEPHYMKEKEKTEFFFSLYNDQIMVYEYHLWNNDKGSGFSMLKEYKVK